MQFSSSYLWAGVLVMGLSIFGLTGCGDQISTSEITGAISGSPASASVQNINEALQTVAEIPLPGGSSRLDYESFNPKTGLLFIAHLGESSVIVFNAKANKVTGEIKGLGGVHGVLAVPELNRVFATATSDHQLAVIDENSLKIIARIPAGNYPDGLAYDPVNHKIYVSDESGESEPVIDTTNNKALNSISIGGDAGNTQYDPITQHIFVNAQSKNELVEIDPKSDQVLARYQLAGCKNNHGLQLDSAQRLAFVACSDNAKLLVLDMQDRMKVISVQSIGADPDVLALDSEKNWLFVACESGTVSIFNVTRPLIQKLAEGFLANGAHIVAVNPGNHQLFFPLEAVNGKPVLRIMQQRSP
jgi:DNA-binding beta-propeller fold protein YncE